MAWRVPQRVQVTGAVASGLMLHYMLRYSLSVAIVCMVKPMPGNRSVGGVNLTFDNTSEKSTCGSYAATSKEHLGFEGEFVWDRKLVGYIIASYFYSYVVIQVFGGWMASHFGGKYIFGLGMLISAVVNMLVPVLSRQHVYWLIAIRVVMGIGTGVTFPCTHAILGNWAPPHERTRLVGFCFACSILGSVIANVVGSQLCTVNFDNGWPLIFYIFGLLTIIWWLVWQYVVYSKPAFHPRISSEEKKYILDSLCQKEQYRNTTIVPWRHILTSPAVWAIVVAHVTGSFGAYTVLNVIPLYMQDVLEFSIRTNGFLSALPTLLQVLVVIGMASASDLLIRKKVLSIAKTRKLAQGIAQVGPFVFMLVLSYMDCTQRELAVSLLCLAVICMSGGRVGYQVNHGDLAPRFAGILYGISNTFANITGFAVPILVGHLTPNGSREEWQKVFFTCGGLYAIGFIVFIPFARGEEQEWAKDKEELDDRELEKTMTAEKDRTADVNQPFGSRD